MSAYPKNVQSLRKEFPKDWKKIRGSSTSRKVISKRLKNYLQKHGVQPKGDDMNANALKILAELRKVRAKKEQAVKDEAYKNRWSCNEVDGTCFHEEGGDCSTEAECKVMCMKRHADKVDSHHTVEAEIMNAIDHGEQDIVVARLKTLVGNDALFHVPTVFSKAFEAHMYGAADFMVHHWDSVHQKLILRNMVTAFKNKRFEVMRPAYINNWFMAKEGGFGRDSFYGQLCITASKLSFEAFSAVLSVGFIHQISSQARQSILLGVWNENMLDLSFEMVLMLFSNGMMI